jgi:glutamyl-tRNA synthetase
MDLKYHLLKAASVSDGQVRGRYAPSPSGVQHLGNIQTAIVAWLQVRLAGGEFALRMDDIDTPRVKAGSATQILEDLRWLGMDWDVIEGIDFLPDAEGVYVESHYLSYYCEAFEALKNRELLYPCSCSRKQIRKRVGKPNAAGHYVYPGTCRSRGIFSFAEDQQLVWRYRAPNETIRFRDQLSGEHTQNVALAWGDLIVKRFNDLYAYQLVSVVDDIKMGITDVVRGEDLLDSTPGQIALFEALGAKPPQFWHVPIKADEEGNKLAKRDGSDSLWMLREEGKTSEEVVGRLAFELGLLEFDEAVSLRGLLDSIAR